MFPHRWLGQKLRPNFNGHAAIVQGRTPTRRSESTSRQRAKVEAILSSTAMAAWWR